MGSGGDGIRITDVFRDNHDHTCIVLVHTHPHLRVRQRKRYYHDKNELRFCSMDSTGLSGHRDPKQHDRHLYADLLHIQRQLPDRHEHGDGHVDGAGKREAHDHICYRNESKR